MKEIIQLTMSEEETILIIPLTLVEIERIVFKKKVLKKFLDKFQDQSAEIKEISDFQVKNLPEEIVEKR